MNILIIYATYSGGTMQASQIIAETLSTHNHTVTTKTAAEVKPDELGTYDLVIFGSPSWEHEGKDGMPHADFVALIQKLEGKTFEGKAFAIWGLGDSSYARFCGAVDHLEELVKNIKGRLAIESLRIDGFFFNQENSMESLKKWADSLSEKLH